MSDMENPIIYQWRALLGERSGNLTTNDAMPPKIVEKLLEEDTTLKSKIKFEPAEFPKFSGVLGKIEGLNIIAGLQSTNKQGSLTLFRGIRFPTFKRIYKVVSDHGYTVANYEQERILELYKRPTYIQKRSEVTQDLHFWTQPQERVVKGLPLFCLVNDALQIHRAFRGEKDQTLIIALHIPRELLETGKIRLIANTAIDLDYANDDRDYAIKDFYQERQVHEVDFEALRSRGIDLHEMYTNDLPNNTKQAINMGISQEFFLLDIYKISKDKNFQALFNDTALLKENNHFLHGFFGDQNIFGRQETVYLPFKCLKVSLEKE